MIKYLKILLVSILALSPKLAYAAVNVINTDNLPDAVKGGPSTSQLLGNVVNILLYVSGIISVIVIIVGGIMYTVSAGNENSTKRAKDAILYAVIGLAISLLAFAIVNFVLKQL